MVCLSHHLIAQTKYLSLTNGLPSNTIYEICQDKTGNHWMGTGKGLVIWNGHKIKVLGLKDNLPDDDILMTRRDRAGRVWCLGANGSIFFFQNGKLKTKFNGQLIPKFRLNSYFSCFYEDQDGTIYIGTFRDGLIQLNENGVKWIKFKGGNSFSSHNSYRKIMRLNKQLLVFHNKGIFEWKNKKQKLVSHIQSDFVEPYKNGFVVIKNNRLYVYDNLNSSLSYNFVFPKVNSLSVSNSIIIVNTISGSYFLKRVNDSIRLIEHRFGTTSINFCYHDLLGNLLVSTSNEGLYFYPRRKTSTLCKATSKTKLFVVGPNELQVIDGIKVVSFNNSFNQSISIDPSYTQIDKILSTRTSKSTVDKNHRLQIENNKDKRIVAFPYDVKGISIAQNAYLIVSSEGLFEYGVSSTKNPFVYLGEIINQKVRYATKDNQNKIWCANDNSFFELKNKRLRSIKTADFSKIYGISCFENSNELIVLTDLGFYKFNTITEKWESIQTYFKIKDWNILDFKLIGKDKILFSCQNGFFVLITQGTEKHQLVQLYDKFVPSFTVFNNMVVFSDGNYIQRLDLNDYLKLNFPFQLNSTLILNGHVTNQSSLNVSKNDQIILSFQSPTTSNYPLLLRYKLSKNHYVYSRNKVIYYHNGSQKNLIVEASYNGLNWKKAAHISLQTTWVGYQFLIISLVIIGLIVVLYFLIKKIRSRVSNQLNSAESSSTEPAFLFIKSGADVVKVFENDILFIQGAKEYIFVFYNDERIITQMSMKALYQQLHQKDDFIQVQKSFIVNKTKIDRVESNRFLHIKDHKIPIGGIFKENVLELFNVSSTE